MAGTQLTERERRWLSVLLILGCVALFYIVVQYTAEAFYYFGDVILTFFMAWFFAFIFSPIVTRLVNAIPRLPRGFATALVYGGLATVLLIVIVGAAQAIVGSIGQFIASQGSIRDALPQILAEWQARLNAIGLGQVDLVAQANAVLANLDQLAAGLVGPLQQTAVASLGVLGNLLIIVFLSIWMVIDRDRIMSFLYRLVPPAFQEEAHLLEAAVGRSFGGFLRGQAAMGGLYFLIALAAGVVFGLPFALFTAAVSGVLMLIPFFGPFVSWAPPVVVAVLTDSPAVLPVLIVMTVGWFILMNIVQPRLMEGAVGIHPIAVLGSVLIGSKIAGIGGAIFAIPFAAVLSAIFFHYLRINSERRSVAERAADRASERAGRPVRVPREPTPHRDKDVTDAPEESPAGG
ncbi:MAG: AI-2E family transporter [Candidatus Limnocylindrales bacterium]